MRVMVLGATGFLGSWTVRALIAAGHDVAAVHRVTSDPWRLDGLPARRAPFAGAEWAELLNRESPDTIVALDWGGVSSSQRDQEIVQSSNVRRQGDLLRAAETAGIPRVVGVGSQAEYGPVDARITEDTPTRPRSAYGRAKVEASRQLEEILGAVDRSWVWARIFSVYGPLEREGTLLPSIADAINSKTRISIREARQGWSYLYASDAGAALAALATSPSAKGIYNVAHPMDPPLRQSISLFADQLGGASVLEFDETGPRASPRLAADTSRLESLGWSASVDHAVGLQATARWMARRPVADPFEPSRMLPVRP